LSKKKKIQEPIYSDKLVSGLEEYVIKDISSIADRPYDTGKFLFSISSFMLVVTLSLVTTFKGHYLFCLISILPLAVSFIYSFNLTLGVTVRYPGDSDDELRKKTGYEIDIDDTMYGQYQEKYNWLAGNVKLWKNCMALFAVILSITITVATIITNNEIKNSDITRNLLKINDSITKVADNLSKVEQAIILNGDKSAIKPLQDVLQQLSIKIDSEHNELIQEFEKNEAHLDRHLDIVTNEIKSQK
jgi:hypothetical protein